MAGPRFRSATSLLLTAVMIQVLFPFSPLPRAGGTPGVIHVDASATGANDGSSWSNAFVELQSALEVAVPGEEIWVAEGTYLPDYDPVTEAHTLDAGASFVLPEGTALYGGFPAGGGLGILSDRDPELFETVLSGDLLGDDSDLDPSTYTDNAEYVVDASDGDVLDGVTVTASGSGAGIVGTDATLMLANLRIIENHSRGLHMVGVSGFELRDSVVARNTVEGAGAGMYVTGAGEALVASVIFEGNDGGNGGGVFSGIPITIANSFFTGNSGCYDCNIGINGGGLTASSTATVVNTVFTGNRAYQGSAIRAWFSHPIVINCTFAGNDAKSGGTIDGADAYLTMSNSILWGNSAVAEIQDFNETTVSYSTIEGGFSGTAVNAWDPDFVDSDGPDDVYGTSDDNVHLGPVSGAIDNGDNNALPVDLADLDGDGDVDEVIPLDLDGNPRLVDRPNADGGSGSAPFVDIGAFELPETAPVAVGDFYVSDEDTGFALAVPGVLGNDSDPEGDEMSVDLVSGVLHGWLDLRWDGSFDYTPHPDWWGTDNFSYRAYDGMLYSDVVTVTIEVAPVNDPPVAADLDGPFIIPGGTSCVDIYGSLLNGAEDPDGDSMTAHLYSNATYLDVTVYPDGTWCAEPTAPWPGSDSFWWRAYDGEYYSEPAEVRLSTNPDIEVADLSLSKTVDRPTAQVGDLLTYTITVHNAGPDPAAEVVVSDVLSSLVQFESASAGCIQDGDTVICELGTLAVGEDASVEIAVVPVAAGQIINGAFLGYPGYDPDGSAGVSVIVDVSLPESPFIDDDPVFVTDIAWMFAMGITKGCNPPDNDLYCPDDVVTRGQMAAFLVRALNLTDRLVDPFNDDDYSIFEADIERLAAAGITRGCNPPFNDMFCPDDPVTRGQMAAFLVRAMGYVDDGGGNLFRDDDDSVFQGDIDRLGTAGVTRGCNPPTNDMFCPDGLVTRGQMAAFLHRALGSG